MTKPMTPAGIASIFECVRPVIFQNIEYGYPALPGTGFLVGLFGEVFFVSASHVLKQFDVNLQRPAVAYTKASNRLIPFNKMHSFRPVDADDWDHTDIVIFMADPETLDRTHLTPHCVFDLGPDNVLRLFRKSMRLHFEGCPSEMTRRDDGVGFIHYASGDLIYEGLTNCVEIHEGQALVNEDCPDFDGLSGSPLFQICDIESAQTHALFAGMLLKGSRTSGHVRFMSGDRIFYQVLGFFLQGLSPDEVSEKLNGLALKHYGHLFRPVYTQRF